MKGFLPVQPYYVSLILSNTCVENYKQNTSQPLLDLSINHTGFARVAWDMRKRYSRLNYSSVLCLHVSAYAAPPAWNALIHFCNQPTLFRSPKFNSEKWLIEKISLRERAFPVESIIKLFMCQWFIPLFAHWVSTNSMPRTVLGVRNLTTRNDLCPHIPYSLGSSFKILSANPSVKPKHVKSLYKQPTACIGRSMKGGSR